MPTLTISKKAFDQAIGKKLPLEILRDRISYLGTDLEKADEHEITVEIFPNRPDMLSTQGFARAFSSFMGLKTGLRQYTVQDSGEKVIIEPSVAKVRPYTACAIVKGITFDDEKIKETIDIQEMLHITYGRQRRKAAIGIYPFEKITPPIRYLARRPEEILFQPLESAKKQTAMQILQQHPAGKQHGHLLDSLELYPLFIDSRDEILSMPPIINSHTVGKISPATRDVFIECSGFDFSTLQKCLNMIVTALADMGGKIFSMKLVSSGKTITTPNLAPENMKIDAEYISRRIGIPLGESQIKKLLERMGYGYTGRTALVPAYRADIMHLCDLAEDIAIAYGYENIPADIPRSGTIAREDNFESFKNKVADLLCGLGLLETNTPHVTSKKQQNSNMNFGHEVVILANSAAAELDSVRSWLIPSLMEVLARNTNRGYPQKIFGIGRVFNLSDKTETGVLETDRLAVLVSHEKADYTESRQILDYILRSIGTGSTIIEAEHPSFLSGRTARVSVGNRKVAYIGEIHPQVLENWGIQMPVSGLELNLNDLYTELKN